MKDQLNKLAAIKQPSFKKTASNEVASTDLSDIPRITNETVTEHREEVLKGARKFIYPLQHSKHRIIVITSVIIMATIISFLTYCIIGLYKLHQTNAFLYRVTQVIPFPIARTGDTFISYENYLFELRHVVHYYETQLQSDFSGKDKQQLKQFRKNALDQVINDAYVKILAKKHDVKVSDKEVQQRIAMVKAQNRLGTANNVLADVLRSYWGWGIRDFERSVRQQLLTEKVTAVMDTAANSRAQDALLKLKIGGNFADLAKQVSEDPATKANGGDYGFKIDKTNRDVPPQVVEALFKMKPGQNSGIIATATSLEIVHLNDVSGDRVGASHISFALKDISFYINDLKEKQKIKSYVKL